MESLLIAYYATILFIIGFALPVLYLWIAVLATERYEWGSIPILFLMLWFGIAIAPTYGDFVFRNFSNMVVGEEQTNVVMAQRAKPAPTRIVLRQEIKRVMLVKMNPPKHFYVTLKWEDDVVTQQYVSKHCNNYADNKIGDMYNIPVTIYRMSDSAKELMYVGNIHKVFCE